VGVRLDLLITQTYALSYTRHTPQVLDVSDPGFLVAGAVGLGGGGLR
jgi:hypothetical protein